jgi:hypothetical protein
MKPFIKYIEQLDADKRLLDIYRKLRKEFQKEGWSEKDLEKPPYYTRRIMELFEQFGVEQKKLGIEVKSYFGNIELSDYMDYIQNKMKEINDETPLDKKGE